MMNGYVVDVNILFSGLLSRKEIYRIIFSENTYYTPDFALIELDKYREVILKKSKLSAEALKEFTLFIFSKIIVVPDYVISENSFSQAKILCEKIDIKDVVYVALAIELNSVLLTRDKVLYEGLISQKFQQVMLFDNFVTSQLNS